MKLTEANDMIVTMNTTDERKFHCTFKNGLTAEATVNKTKLLHGKSADQYFKVEWTPRPPTSLKGIAHHYIEWMCTVQQALANMKGASVLYAYCDPETRKTKIAIFKPNEKGFEGDTEE